MLYEQEILLISLRDAWKRIKDRPNATPDDIPNAWQMVREERWRREDLTRLEAKDLFARLNAQIKNDPSATRKSYGRGTTITRDVFFKTNDTNFVFLKHIQEPDSAIIVIHIAQLTKDDERGPSMQYPDRFEIEDNGSFTHFRLKKAPERVGLDQKVHATNLDCYSVLLKGDVPASMNICTDAISAYIAPPLPIDPT
ncbi:MAG: hypothetical protein AAB907_01780 [Patescibacteria group bacterium]